MPATVDCISLESGVLLGRVYQYRRMETFFNYCKQLEEGFTEYMSCSCAYRKHIQTHSRKNTNERVENLNRIWSLEAVWWVGGWCESVGYGLTPSEAMGDFGLTCSTSLSTNLHHQNTNGASTPKLTCILLFKKPNIGKPAKNKRLSPFSLRVDKFTWIPEFLFFWCVMFNVTNAPDSRQRQRAVRRPLTMLRWLLFYVFYFSLTVKFRHRATSF